MVKHLFSLVRYLVARGSSAVITVSLFGLFARDLIHQDLENALSFTLIFGFFGAITRTLASFAAQIQPNHSSDERALRVIIGYKSVLLAQIVVTPLFLAMAFAITESPLVSFIAAFKLFFSGFDFDLSRAARAQEMLFPPLFLSGSIAALAYFSLSASPSQQTAFIATLIQWFPVALYSGYQLSLVGLRRIALATAPTRFVILSLLIVSFDGFILNLPMMPFISISEEVRIEMAILTRNFISSLFVLPFIIYLSNRISTQGSARGCHYHKWLFFVGVFFSSIGAFLIYSIYFELLSGRSVEMSGLQVVVPLALGFAAYYANARYFEAQSQGGLIIAGTMLSIAIGATAIVTLVKPNVTQIVLLQSASFIIMTTALLLVGYLRARPELSR